MTRLAFACLAAIGLWGGAATAGDLAAACTGIDRGRDATMIGPTGVAFRVLPDLQTGHGLSEPAIAAIAGLADALRGAGTELVVLPLPTKALANPGALPTGAAGLSYDPELAAAIYDHAVRRLRQSGVRAANGREALRLLADAGTPPHLATDPRPSPTGALALAVAAAAELRDVVPDQPMRTPAEGATLPLESAHHARLQARCAGALPPLTVRSRSAPTATTGAPILLAGMDLVATEALGLGPALSALTGRPVRAHGVAGDDPVAALLDLLSSEATARDRPAALVWALPIWADPLARGPDPLLAARAAAGAATACDRLVPLGTGSDGALQGDLSGVPTGDGTVLRLELGTGLRAVRLTFATDAGATRTKTVAQAPDRAATGTFHVPLTGLWSDGAARVTIAADGPTGLAPRAAACRI